MKAKHIAIIDPAVKTAELDCFNQLSLNAPGPLSYHLPALFGMSSLEAVEHQLSGIIILGSSSSVYDRLPWQIALESWINRQFEAKCPTLGFCYGHQMIAHMLGGKVGFLFDDKHKLQGFREVQLNPNSLWKNASPKGLLYVSHREAVTESPSCMEIVGSSKEVKIDALAHKSLPIWSFQAHPEATPEFIKNMGDTDSHFPSGKNFGMSLIEYFFDYTRK